MRLRTLIALKLVCCAGPFLILLLPLSGLWVAMRMLVEQAWPVGVMTAASVAIVAALALRVAKARRQGGCDGPERTGAPERTRAVSADSPGMARLR
ncbi:MAG: hypothetical protein C4346_06360 [Chloroflexota bacterium]